MVAAGAAGEAVAAGDPGAEHDRVAGGEVVDAGSERVDRAGDLAARYQR